MLIVATVVLTVVVVVRIAEASESYLVWVVFAAMVVCGLTTVLQAARWGRFGSGHVLIMGTSGTFIAVCVAALKLAGPATLASLVVISSLFQFMLAARLSLLRRIFTPVVTGTVIMLIAATVAPVIYDSLNNVPEGTDPIAALLAARGHPSCRSGHGAPCATVATTVVSSRRHRRWVCGWRSLRPV